MKLITLVLLSLPLVLQPALLSKSEIADLATISAGETRVAINIH